MQGVNRKSGRLVNMYCVEEDDEVMIITDGGTLLWLAVKEIPVYGRAAQGVKLINLKGGEKIAGVSMVVEKSIEE